MTEFDDILTIHDDGSAVRADLGAGWAVFGNVHGGVLMALALAVVPTALTGAWVLRFVKDPVQLLAAPGLGAPAGGTYADLLPWQAALGLLSAPASWSAYLLGPALVLAPWSTPEPGPTPTRSPGRRHSCRRDGQVR